MIETVPHGCVLVWCLSMHMRRDIKRGVLYTTPELELHGATSPLKIGSEVCSDSVESLKGYVISPLEASLFYHL